MLGKKERHFAPLVNGSLEELVPQDHFYRHLERTLDLSFVREFVQEKYAGKGRPSVDPVVFFKLQLVMFFEGIRSERQLMCHAAGLVWGKELYFDGTKVAANAGKDSLKPRFYVDAHLDSLFGETSQSTEQESLPEESAGSAADQQEERPAPAPLPTSLSPEEQEPSPRRIPSGMTGLRSWEHKTAALPVEAHSVWRIC